MCTDVKLNYTKKNYEKSGSHCTNISKVMDKKEYSRKRHTEIRNYLLLDDVHYLYAFLFASFTSQLDESMKRVDKIRESVDR